MPLIRRGPAAAVAAGDAPANGVDVEKGPESAGAGGARPGRLRQGTDLGAAARTCAHAHDRSNDAAAAAPAPRAHRLTCPTACCQHAIASIAPAQACSTWRRHASAARCTAVTASPRRAARSHSLSRRCKSPPSPDVGERGSYDVDEHLLSPQEVAAKFGTSVDWGSIPGSKGLASEQASGGVAACCMPPLAAAMRAPAAACTPAVLACGGPAAARGCMRPRMRRRGRAARMRRLKPPPCKLRQVKALRELHGLNRLTPPKERSEIVKFLLQVSV